MTIKVKYYFNKKKLQYIAVCIRIKLYVLFESDCGEFRKYFNQKDI
jgi:hypothetical protein